MDCKSAQSIIVSVILPVHNAALWLHEALRSIEEQDISSSTVVIEVSAYEDRSTVSIHVTVIFYLLNHFCNFSLIIIFRC